MTSAHPSLSQSPEATAANPPEMDGNDRDQARLRLDRNVVVEAGAGTGKTSLLTDRILFLLLGADIPITKIVALTFTEKAATEITVRLADRLAAVIASLEGLSDQKVDAFLSDLAQNFGIDGSAAKERARQALEDMDKAMIGTLHSFAGKLLRAYPLQARVDPAFQVDEGDHFDDLFSLEWDRWLEVELAEGSQHESAWINLLGSVTLSELEELARALCEPRLDLSHWGTPPPGMLSWIRETVSILKQEPVRQPAARGGIVDQLEEICKRLNAVLAADTSILPDGASDLPLPRPAWPKAWDRRNYDRYLSALRIAEKVSVRGEALISCAVGLLSPFAAHFRRIFSWRGLISFNGLLVAARDLVRDNPEVRGDLKQHFSVFLVDEFQDTDPMQGELLMFLSERSDRSATRWEDVELEPGKLFVVGDPKQSIYRFRGADLAAYERFTRHMLDNRPGALFCELKTNFRSNSGLLNPINAAFPKLIRYSEHSQPEYKPIFPSVKASKPERINSFSLTVLVEPEERGKGTVEDVRKAEAEWAAAWIEQHCLADKSYRLKDVALLLRTTTPLEIYLDVFRERQIPYVIETEKYFYGTQEAQDFLNLLHAVDDPSDRRSLVGLLRSPLVGIPDPLLYQLAEENGLDYTEAPSPAAQERDSGRYGEAQDRVRAFYQVLRSLHSGVGRRPLAGLVGSIVEQSRVLEFLPAAYHGQQTLANLTKFIRMSTEADNGGMTLREFIRKVSNAIEESIDEGESPLADEHLDAVRIMTIHKSKGLEFPVVFIPNLSGKIQRSRDRRPLRLDWGSEAVGAALGKRMSLSAAYLEMKERKKEEDETARLLYVACTRAKERLILMGSKDADAGAFSALLQEAGIWPEGGHGIDLKTVTVGTTLPAGNRRATPASAKELLSDRDLELRWKARFARCREWESLPWCASPSQATHAMPWPGVVANSRTAGTIVGQVCHKVLERWDWKSPNVLKKKIAEAGGSLSLERPIEDWSSVSQECEHILSGFFQSDFAKKLSGAEIIGREVPFSHGSNGQVLRGSIDLLYRLEGKIFIADYKTDAVTRRQMGQRAKLYQPQARMYSEAVRRGLGVDKVTFEVVFLRLGAAVEL